VGRCTVKNLGLRLAMINPHTKFEVSVFTQATGYEPSHRACKPAYLCLSQARTNWEGCIRKGIWHKNGGDGRDGAPISLDGWQSIRIVGVLFSFCTGKSRIWQNVPCWYQHTWVVPDKVQRAVKWLCLFTHYEDMKGNAKCIKWGSLGV